MSEGKALENLFQNTLRGWKFCWSQAFRTVRDISEDPVTCDPRGEGFAFAWNPNRLTLATSSTTRGERVYQPRSISQAMRHKNTEFSRTPYYARFIPVHGGFFEFRLINVHLHFGANIIAEIDKRQTEFNYLVENVYPTLSMERRYGNNRPAYTIVMGDYNLNLNIPRGDASKRINSNTYIPSEIIVGSQRIVTVQDQLTTLKYKRNDTAYTDEDEENAEYEDDNPERGYSQNYDHFTFDAYTLENANIGYHAKRIDAVRKYYNDDFEGYRINISDHIPIVLELTMNV